VAEYSAKETGDDVERSMRLAVIALAVFVSAGATASGARAARADAKRPPDTTILSAPSGTVASSTAAFRFAAQSTDHHVTFQCKLDSGAWSPCTSPRTYTGLPDGARQFAVRAMNRYGTDPTPATASWTIDTTAPPLPQINSAPTGTTSSRDASISFSDAETGVTFLCSRDGGAAAACTSPVSYTGLADGQHTFSVSAQDAAGNKSAPQTVAWTINTTVPPEPTIVSGTSGATTSTSASFTFTDSDASATFVCSVDGGPAQGCTSPASLSGLGVGSHSFTVAARNSGGNTSRAVERAWSVEPESVVNGSFEGSLQGWSSSLGTLSQASDGVQGPGAVKVTANAGANSWVTVFPTPRPVQSTGAGYVYHATGWVRSDHPGDQICLRIREYNQSATLLNTIVECMTTTTTWQQFPTMTYIPTAAGDQLTAFAYEPTLAAGGTYEADGMSLYGGPPALLPTNGDPSIAAAGDIACAPDSPQYNNGLGTGTQCMQQSTANLIGSLGNLQALLPIGDEQYDCGELANFNTAYDSSWGRFKSITHPVPGNHEYGASNSCASTSNAAGYYSYFGAAAGDPTKGYYSYDIGTWHVVAVNSQCSVVSCAAGSPEETWLRNDLATHTAKCTLVYWHQPRWSVGQVGDEPDYDAFWQDIVNAHVELVLNGHDHTYQRYTPMNGAAAADPNGVREVVVGTGGEELFGTLGARSTLEAEDNTSFGVLQLVLHPDGYDAQFIPAAGGNFSDSFSGSCH